MNNKDSLFILIKSLTRNEKGYFKKFVSKYSAADKNRYVQLFNIIEAQGEYNEEKVKEKIKKLKENVDLSVLKNYLYHAILKSLRSFHNELSIESKLQDMLKDAEILNTKSLYTDAENILKKALTLARRYQRHTILLDIHLQLYRLIMLTEKNKKEYEKFIDQYLNEQLEILKAYTEITQYRMLLARIAYLPTLRANGNTEKADIELSNILQSALLQKDATFLSYKARFNYYWILGVLNTFPLNDQVAAYNYNKTYVRIVERDPLLLSEEIVTYIAALNNFMINLVRLKKYDEFETTLVKLKKIPPRFPMWKLRVMESEWNTGLLYYIKSGEIDKGLEFLKDQEKIFLENESGMSKTMRVGIYDSISVLYFIAGDYSAALKWVNKIILGDWSVRLDVTCFSHLLALFIQFEKKNYDLIEHVYEHTYRFITNHMGQDGIECLLLKFIKRAVFLSDDKQLPLLLKELKQDMLNHPSENTNPNFFELFDPLIWVDSKLKAITMKELYSNKFK
jgi:hypothetical protein